MKKVICKTSVIKEKKKYGGFRNLDSGDELKKSNMNIEANESL